MGLMHKPDPELRPDQRDKGKVMPLEMVDVDRGMTGPGERAGKLAKLASEICFLEQPFVKDDKRKVSKVLDDLSKEVGTKIDLVEYVYMKLGAD